VHTLILFNKPFRVLCQFSGGGPGRHTLADFIDVPVFIRRAYAITTAKACCC